MKTLDELRAERQQNITDSNGLIEKEKKKYRSRVVFLDGVIAYLEFNPKDEIITKQLEQVKKKIKSVKQLISSQRTKESIQKCKSENGYKKLQSQLKVLNYILS